MRRNLKDQDDFVGYMRRMTGTIGAPPDDRYQNMYSSCGDEYVEDILGGQLPAHLLPIAPAGNGCGYLTEDEVIARIDFRAGHPVEESVDNRLLAILGVCVEEMQAAVESAKAEAEEKVETKAMECRELNSRIAQLCCEHQRLCHDSKARKLDRQIRNKCGEHKRLIRERRFREAKEVGKEITALKRKLADLQNPRVAELDRVIRELKARLSVLRENLPVYERLMARAVRLADEHLDKLATNLRDAEGSILCPEAVVCDES